MTFQLRYLLSMVPSCSSTICWKSYHSFIELLLHIYGRLVGIHVWVCFCVLYSVRLICVDITWPIAHYIDFCAVELSHSIMYDSLFCDPMDYTPPGSSVHGDSPGKNTGVGCHALLQGIFLTQRSKPVLSHCRWIPWPKDQSQVSLIIGGFFTDWVTREACLYV